jgi:hypothetical protein
MGAFSYTTGPCHVCGKILTAAGFARVAHEDMHVRNGELIAVHVWSWKGLKLRTKLVLPTEVASYEAQQYFVTFERCKEAFAYFETEALASRDVNP